MSRRVECLHCRVWIIWSWLLDRWVRGRDDEQTCPEAADGRHRIGVSA